MARKILSLLNVAAQIIEEKNNMEEVMFFLADTNKNVVAQVFRVFQK